MEKLSKFSLKRQNFITIVKTTLIIGIFLIFSLFIFLKAETAQDRQNSLNVCSQLLRDSQQQLAACSTPTANVNGGSDELQRIQEDTQFKLGNFTVMFKKDSIEIPFDKNKSIHDLSVKQRSASQCGNLGDNYFVLDGYYSKDTHHTFRYTAWNSQQYAMLSNDFNKGPSSFQQFLIRPPDGLSATKYKTDYIDKVNVFFDGYTTNCMHNYFSYLIRHHRIINANYNLVRYFDVFEGQDYDYPDQYLVVQAGSNWLLYHEDGYVTKDNPIYSQINDACLNNSAIVGDAIFSCIADAWSQEFTIEDIEAWTNEKLSSLQLE